MTAIPYIKSFLQEIPRPIGNFLSKIPYRVRPVMGTPYAQHQKNIQSFDGLDVKRKKDFVLAKIQRVLQQSMNIPFYRELYASEGINSKEIQNLNFEDIARLPIVTKDMLKNVPLQERAVKRDGAYITNTGGSSGSTLDFFITPGLIPIEWAHMHTIWEKLGYNQSLLKFGFGGRNLGNDKKIVYDGLRHQFSINVYKNIKNSLPLLRKILRKEKVYYLHGYPSALAEFSINLKRYAPDLVQVLRTTLQGAFLSSEYPAPMYRDRIEEVFGIPTVSWYGHTERAILAWEKKEKFVYHPFQTYGYCELIPNSETGGWKLIGTSYNNFASPFIRYDTGDDVEPVKTIDGLLISFRVRSGRLGEFVIDRKGVKIPLTAIIFGRHHPLFDISLFIQVHQKHEGHMTVIVTPKEKLNPDFKFQDWFDSSGLDLDVDFKIVEKPILSPSGKITLKISELNT